MKEQLIEVKQTQDITIDSREVAEMIEKEHSKLMRDIRTYCNYLNEAKIGLVKYFIESTYKDSKGEERPCYLITKLGCEMCANKMTGKKGIIFTAKYVERFNEMEQHIKQESQFKLPQSYKEALLQLVEQVEQNEKLNTVIETMQPKAIIGDRFTNSDNAWDMNLISKVLSIKGMGRNNLFAWLRNQEILRSNNEPFQKYIEHFRVIATEDDYGRIHSKTLVKSKGIEFIVKRLIKDGYILTKSINEMLEELNS